jgi:uncharacterized membrane protein YphA (DoxX/SURF4 family)
MKILRIIFRTILGLTFMFSGFVKGVDPLGSVYKFQEYFEAYGMEWLSPLALTLAILLCAIEFTIGVMLILGVKPKISSWLAFIMMFFFTGLTLLSYINNPVKDCGCFGDALKLSNLATFIKNLILLIPAAFLVATSKFAKQAFKPGTEISLIILGIGIMVFTSIFCLRHLPIIDSFPFRKELGLWQDLPWKTGDTISKQVIPTPEISQVVLVYKNEKTGLEEEYTAKTLPYKDSLKWANIKNGFLRQDKKIIQNYKEAPIHDFVITDKSVGDSLKDNMNYLTDDSLTKSIIMNPKYQFILVAYDIMETKKSAYPDIIRFVEECDKDSISFVGLTATIQDTIDDFRNKERVNFPFYNVDETSLKSMIRANPGVLLLHNGVVMAKWHWRDLPLYKDVKKEYIK